MQYLSYSRRFRSEKRRGRALDAAGLVVIVACGALIVAILCAAWNVGADRCVGVPAMMDMCRV